ncbi:MAG TPA: ABC transporter ATP-binding protein [Thermoplasmata archaeon]|nr:ABC transporter ATP-binding protein [Thermoplasmata archaeon]
MLRVEGLVAGYYGSTVLDGIDFTSRSGVTLVIGPNGAGKSTLIRSIVGLLRPVLGRIEFDGHPIQSLRAEAIAKLGIATVPERARLFRELRVIDNLRIGSRLAERRGEAVDFEADMKAALALFPDLKPKLPDRASGLSGGQQQMLSIARALVTHPRLLVMDEPTTGLHPTLVKELVVKIEEVARGLPILLTEQNVMQTVPIASQVYLLEAGRIVLSGSSAEVLADDRVRRVYLGERREGPEPLPAGGS